MLRAQRPLARLLASGLRPVPSWPRALTATPTSPATAAASSTTAAATSEAAVAAAAVAASGATVAAATATKAPLAARLAEGPSFEDFLRAPVGEAPGDEAVRVTPARRRKPREPIPPWLRTSVPIGENYARIKRDLRGLGLNTVCEEARCPNLGTCWGGSESETATATIMLMGDECTRGCRFCSVKTNRAPAPLDPTEPEHTAEAISRWGLDYIVMTSVDRDDVADGGAAHFAETVERTKAKNKHILIECLTGDFRGDLDAVRRVALSGLDVYAHNIETTRGLTPFVRDRRATYDQSLAVLAHAKQCWNDHVAAGQPIPNASGRQLITKTSIMLGLGETDDEILQTLKDLRAIDVDVVTFGQYMQPTKKHLKVDAWVAPEKFKALKDLADGMGFRYVASGPLVRSSYRAGEYYIKNMIQKDAEATRKQQMQRHMSSNAAATAATAASSASSASSASPPLSSTDA